MRNSLNKFLFNPFSLIFLENTLKDAKMLKMDILKLYTIYLMIRVGFRRTPVMGWSTALDSIRVGEYAILGQDIRLKRFRPVLVPEIKLPEFP